MATSFGNKVTPSNKYMYYTCLEILAHSYMGITMYNQLIMNRDPTNIETLVAGCGMIWTVAGIYDHIDKYLYHSNYNYTFINSTHVKWTRFVPVLIVLPGFIATTYMVFRSTIIGGSKSNPIKTGIWLLFILHSILSKYTFNKIDRRKNWSSFEFSEFVTHIADIGLFALLKWAIN